jgi:ATP-binding cassette subfamily F protein uup
VLDEPTNDLDIETLELLEALLEDYDGTVLLVSHDRAFLDAVVTQTLAYEGDGRWKEYAGGYEDWARVRRTPPAQPAPAVRPRPAPKPAPRPEPAGPRKLTFAERRELDALPARIDALEAEHAALGLRLADPALYQRSPQDVAAVRARLQAVEGELADAMQRWEGLAARE